MTRIGLREPTRKLRKLARILRNPAYHSALRQGVAAAVEHERIPYRRDVRTVIDVGAGKGQFAVFALHRFPNAQIWCFEPLPASYAKAERVLGRLDRVHLRRCALGSQSGNSRLQVSADQDSSSLLKQTAAQALHFPGTAAVATIEVELRSLDEAIPSLDGPALLKLDVQGAELDVLIGAEQALASVAELVVECSLVELYAGQALADRVIAHLLQRGFRLVGAFSPALGRDGTIIQADLLFRAGEARSR
jgi:FkbM family methyltransferase